MRYIDEYRFAVLPYCLDFANSMTWQEIALSIVVESLESVTLNPSETLGTVHLETALLALGATRNNDISVESKNLFVLAPVHGCFEPISPVELD